MAAPVYPSVDEIASQLAEYVDVDAATSSADPDYIADCAQEAVDWLTHTIGTAENVPESAYVRAALEIGNQLFRRRRSWSTVEQLETPPVQPVRVNPYTAAYPILAPYIGPVIA